MTKLPPVLIARRSDRGRRPALVAFCLAALLVSLLSPQALGAEFTWGNTGQTWNFNASWVGGTAPANSTTTDTALFSNVGAGFNSPKFSANRSIAGVTFSATANAYTFLDDGFSLTIGSSGIVHGAANTQTFNTLLVLGSSQTWNLTNGGTLSVQAVDLSTSSTSRTLTLAGNGTIAINGAITSSGGSTSSAVTVTATGNTTLAGNNTYGGLTTMNAGAGTLTLSGDNSGTSGGVRAQTGTLNINHANALGSGTLDIRNAATLDNTSGAALVNAGNNAVTWGESATGGFAFGTASSTAANNLDLGSGIVTANTDRTMSFAGTGTTLSMGTLQVSSTATTGRTLTANGAGNTLFFRAYNIRSSDFATAVQDILAGSANWTIDGTIANGNANANGLRIDATGITTFNGASTYEGLTTVSANATLKLGHAQALGGTTGGTTVLSGGSLDLNGQAIGAEALTLRGSGVDGNGALYNGAAAASSLAGSVNLGLSSTLKTVAGGSIDLSGALDLNASSASSRTLTIDGAGTTTLSGNISNSFAGSTGNMIVSGAGNTLILSGSNSYTGSTTLGAGTTLRATTAHSLSANSTLAGAATATQDPTLDLATGAYTLGNYTGGSLIFAATNGAASVTFTNTGTANTIVGAGRTLTTDNVDLTFAGDLDISATTADKILTFAGNGNVTVSSAVIVTNTSFAATLRQNSSGTTILNGANTYTGGTMIDNGTLQIGNGGATGTLGGGGVTNDATLAFNRTGTLTVTNQISGTGALGKSGAGTVTLTASNSYDGTTTVGEGVLAIGNDNALGSTNAGTVVDNGAQLRLTNNVTVGNEALTISGTGLPAGDGAAGALRNESGDNTWGGLITLVANAIIEALLGTRLTLDVDAGDAINLSSFTATFSGGGTHHVNDAIGGTGGLTKAGTGTLHLAGSNRFTGATAVTGGVLNLNSSAGSSLESTASVSVTNAILLISQSDQVNDSATVTLSGGTVQRGSGVSEVFGNLNLTEASFLDFGTGATGNLTFGTYQDNAETPSALLTLNNFLPGNSFTFSSTSFSTNNVASYFTFGTGYAGSSITNTGSTFTITAIPEPSTVAAAVGLIGLMLWPARRRLGSLLELIRSAPSPPV